MFRARWWLAVSATLVGTLSACGPPTAPALPPAPMASPHPGSPSDSDAQAAAVDAALRDAAGRAGSSTGAADVHVQRAEARDWPDSSLGCPSQGMMYAQVVTPGFVVILSAAGTQLEYHTDRRGRVVLCSSG